MANSPIHISANRRIRNRCSQDAAILCCILFFRELSTTEGCHTRSDAILRLASAAEEIDTIVATLHNAQQ